jgi:uncharacterized protein YjbJ (UPF0337 family)
VLSGRTRRLVLQAQEPQADEAAVIAFLDWWITTTEGSTMNWDRIEGNWKQLKGQAQLQWGKLTDDDLALIAGRREQLAGKLQERYGLAKDVADTQVSAWLQAADDSWFKR